MILLCDTKNPQSLTEFTNRNNFLIMSRKLLMFKSQTLLSILIYLSTCIDLGPAIKLLSIAERHLIMSTLTSNNGKVPIINKNGVYMVQANVSESSTATVDMMVNIYGGGTVFTNSCLDFNNFDSSAVCKTSNCNLQPTGGSTLSTAYFKTPYSTNDVKVVLDSEFWKLNQTALVNNAACESLSMFYGQGSVGFIGLGYTGSSSVGNAFRIQLNPDESNKTDSGRIIFVNDASVFQFPDSFSSFSVSKSTWSSSASSYTFSSNSTNFGSALQVIFDINTDAIAMPLTNYIQLLTDLSSCILGCKEIGLPTCYNITPIEKFPSIFLNLADGSQIEIPPQLYAQPAPWNKLNNRIILGFRGLSFIESGASFIAIAYQNAIILGSNFMKYYSTVFDSNTSKVSFYVAPSYSDVDEYINTPTDDNNDDTPDDNENSDNDNNPDVVPTPTPSPDSNSDQSTDSSSDSTTDSDSGSGSTVAIVIIILLILINIFGYLFYYNRYLSPAAVAKRRLNENATNNINNNSSISIQAISIQKTNVQPTNVQSTNTL